MKRLVLCCDGTWQNLEKGYPTNVVKIAQAVMTKDQSGDEQIVYYDEGVGAEGGVGPLTREVTAVVGGALGRGIDKNIQDAYRFLVMNYEDGDEIYLFGFSRGAYTVRSLAGLIGKSGLLAREHIRWISEAYEYYRCKPGATNGSACGPDSPNEDVADYHAFIARHPPRFPTIKLLGIWDTVGSLGFPDVIEWLPFDRALNQRYQFHDNKVGAHVENVHHAVAIDERRKQFMVSLVDAEDPSRTRVVEEWFPGDHGCIGGGSFEKRGLSDIALHWMLEGAHSLGLAYDVNKIEVDVSRFYKQAEPQIETGLCMDHTIFVSGEINPPYTAKQRDIAELYRTAKVNLLSRDPTMSAVFHDSARLRWRDCRCYRETSNLKPFADELDRWAADHPNALAWDEGKAELSVGAAIEVEVDSAVRTVDDQTWRVQVEVGQRYRFEVLKPQVWQDGSLPPCSADGWDEDDLRGMRTALRGPVRWLGSARRNAQANWFELVGAVVTAEGEEAQPFRLGAFPAEDLVIQVPGTLFCFANDLPGVFYANNEGCLRIRVTRTA